MAKKVEVHVTGAVYQVREHPGGYEPFAAWDTDDGVAIKIEGSVVDDFDEALHQAMTLAAKHAVEKAEIEVRSLWARSGPMN